ncbi:MAG: glucose-6-phosphate isomerase, partial [Bdellovibrionia bacterium]
MIKLTHTTLNSESEMSRATAALGMLRARRDLGFLKLPERGELWLSCQARAKATGKKLVVLGIGGSSLGGRALMDSGAITDVEFFENVDGRDFSDRLERIADIENVHWAVISKSGQTIETLGQTSFVVQKLESTGVNWKNKFTVVTEKKSNPLHDWAKANGIPVLEVPVDVGGRFSVLSPVGMFPAAVAGFDLEQIKSGASWALKQDSLIANLVAQSLASWKRDEWVTLFWAYSNRLWTTGLWMQQLWAESLAKKNDRQGKPAPRASTPIPLIGANDQHSVLQQVAEGARDKFIWFMRVKDSETAGPVLKKSLFSTQAYLESKTLGSLLAAEAQATAKALQQNQVQSLTLEIERLDAQTMGALFMLIELVVGSL